MYITFPYKFDLQKLRINMVLIIFCVTQGMIYKYLCLKEKQFTVNSTYRCWKGNEPDVKREAAIFIGQQLVHFAQHFPYSFSHYSSALPGET
jgi:hypothetical protein